MTNSNGVLAMFCSTQQDNFDRKFVYYSLMKELSFPKKYWKYLKL